jgi:hypothetical protein
MIGACDLGSTITLGQSLPATPEPSFVLGFTNVELVAELSSEEKNDNPTLTGDQLLICFTSNRPGGPGDVDIFCAERTNIGDDFSEPVAVPEINSSFFETSSALSLDGLTLWFGSAREGGVGGTDIYRARRNSRNSAWSAPELVAELNSEADDIPRPPAMGDRVMPMSSRRTDDIYRTYWAERADSAGTFSDPELVKELSFEEKSTVDAQLSEDGLLILFSSTGDDSDPGDLFAARRGSLGEPFGEPTPLQGVNSAADDRDPWLSPDGDTLYFSSNRDGHFEIYRATRVWP